MDLLPPLPGVALPWELEDDFGAVQQLALPDPKNVESGQWQGIPAADRVQWRSDLVTDPANANDVIRPYDVQRCIAVDPELITPAGVSFEVVHFEHPAGSLLIIEDIPTIWDSAEALDGQGLPIFNYTSLNGERLCRSSLIHPTPAVGDLTWRWDLVWTDRPSIGEIGLAYQGPVAPSQISGTYVRSPWRDNRYGPNSPFNGGKYRQFSVPASAVVRLWLTLFGPASRYRVHLGARVAGFFQFGGHDGRALDSATQRRV